MIGNADRRFDPNSVRHMYPAVWPQWPFNEPPKVREQSQPIYSIHAETDVWIPMRDGVRLAADIYRPRSAGQKFPALLAISPYTRGLQLTEVAIGQNEAGLTEFWVPRGYVHIIVDCRGTNDSEGVFDNRGPIEQKDFVELIHWAASQPWCNGSVGMAGCSYFSLVQFLSAIHQPEPLKAIFPYDSWTDKYRHLYYPGGIPQTGYMWMWFSAMSNLLFNSGRQRDRAGVEKMMREGMGFEHPFDGEHYREVSPQPHMHKVRIPTYFGSDWSFYWDHLPGVFAGWEGATNAPKRMLVGPRPQPWRPYGSYHQEALRWYDQWLKGMDTGAMEGPPIQLYIQGENTWRGEVEWPLARAEWRKFHLGGPGGGPVGMLSDSSGAEGSRSYVNDPLSREWRYGRPRLVYRSEPLSQALEVTGPLALHLAARSSAQDTDWIVTLHDEAPDGATRLLTRGCLRASHRELDEKLSRPGRPWHPHTRSVPLAPSHVEVFEIEIVPTSNVFLPGHRVRIEVGSCASAVDRVAYLDTLPIRAENTVIEGGRDGSYLLASVVPR
ncbi:MAG: CocE/NonD family hydrolase [Nitrospinota bacterium]